MPNGLGWLKIKRKLGTQPRGPLRGQQVDQWAKIAGAFGLSQVLSFVGGNGPNLMCCSAVFCPDWAIHFHRHSQDLDWRMGPKQGPGMPIHLWEALLRNIGARYHWNRAHITAEFWMAKEALVEEMCKSGIMGREMGNTCMRIWCGRFKKLKISHSQVWWVSVNCWDLRVLVPCAKGNTALFKKVIIFKPRVLHPEGGSCATS